MAEGHVEILLPPHQGVVRPPEGHIGQIRGQPDREGGELLFPSRVGLLGEAHDPDVPEPGAGGQGGEEPTAVLLVPDPAEEPGEGLCPEEVPQGDPHPVVEGGDLRGKMVVGQPGEDQAVHPAKGPGSQRIQVLFGVGNDVFHGGGLPSVGVLIG